MFMDEPLILILLPNIIIGMLIAYPIWNYLRPQLSYKPKNILIPCSALFYSGGVSLL
jgi:hypothetical protein